MIVEDLKTELAHSTDELAATREAMEQARVTMGKDRRSLEGLEAQRPETLGMIALGKLEIAQGTKLRRDISKLNTRVNEQKIAVNWLEERRGKLKAEVFDSSQQLSGAENLLYEYEDLKANYHHARAKDVAANKLRELARRLDCIDDLAKVLEG